MLHVVLDTNAVGIIRPMAGGAHELALQEAFEGRIRLVVPELVIQEAVNGWTEGVKAQDRRRNDARDELVRRGALQRRRVNRIDLTEARRREEDRLRAILSWAGALIPELPSTSHEAVVQRALDRRRPFDPEGKDGYRDTLLWETVIALVREGQDVLLVSGDKRAFGEGSPPRLAASLAREVLEAGGREDSVTLAADMRAALEQFIESSAEILAGAEDLLADDRFWEDFVDQFYDALFEARIPPALIRRLGLPTVVSEAELIDVTDVGHFEVLAGRSASGARSLVEAILSGPARVRLTFPARDYAAVASTVDLVMAAQDAEEDLATIDVSCNVTLRVDVLIDLGAETLIDVSISEVTDLGP